MLTNAVITIFNRVPNAAEREFVYIPHVLTYVWVHTSRKVVTEQGGLTSNPIYKIRIPFPRPGWLPPEVYGKGMDSGDSWTVREKDLFMIGAWPGGEVKGIEDIKKEFSGTVGVVLNYSENFFGSSKHIRIEGGD